MKYFYNIERHNGAAVVQIIEIIRRDDGSIAPNGIVEQYETASIGATASARKAIKRLETD